MKVCPAFSVEGKVFIVTGGGTGIGKYISLECAKAGAKVAIASRRMEHLEPIVKQIKDLGGLAMAVVADVRKPEDIDNMVQKTIEQFGTIDVLVNNHGASFRAPLEEVSLNGWNSVISINLTGVFLCSKAVAKKFIEWKKPGKIISLSSIAGRDGSNLMAHYGAAKAGVINLTKTMALEWSKYGIHVNSIAPGFIETDGVKEVFGAEVVAKLSQMAPLRRAGRPEEIAYTVLFLASDASSYVQGETICVDGGPLCAE
ncbi:MAG: glucose 1-dehydrogenase [Candidatus Tectomicrobia bacterium]|uniref:Glucose 1-dehydrogenase n=1 Tax=Tectimicrobiota bacterium TaxID=2528274 RepID=A0A933GMD0_UNCTE|nr:glucose 1-dehydrogenase [Candidatus Tectomicrobia bacterium]